MKTIPRFLPIISAVLLTALMFCITNCGYHNPNVYNGPQKVIYVKEWKNRTSQLGLDTDLYRSLNEWFQNSSSISIVRKQEHADLILAGEIVSIELPSLAYNSDNTANEVSVRLRVRYVLKDLTSGKIVLEEPNQLWSEEYIINSVGSINEKREEDALEQIVDDISKRIYQRTVGALPKL